MKCTARRLAPFLALWLLALGLAGCDLLGPAVTPLPMGWVTHEVKLLDTPYLAISAPVIWRAEEGEDACCSVLSLTGPPQPDGSRDRIDVVRYRSAPSADEDWASWIRDKGFFADLMEAGLATEEPVSLLGGEAIRWTVSFLGQNKESYAFPPRDGILIVVEFKGDLEDPAVIQAILDTFEFLESATPSAS